MCLVAWHWQPGTLQALLLLANRDEFYARPALPLHWWEDDKVLAGRDVTGGGTWLGITRSGRMAVLTNYRDPAHFRTDAASRGALVSGFLQGTLSAPQYLQSVLPQVDQYNAFNLLVCDGQQLMGLESRHGRVFTLEDGIGAVSNADFFSPWPKVEQLKAGLARAQGLAHPQQDQALWDLLRSEQQAPDHALPQTGIPLQRERALSSAFIAIPDYGTRASTLVKLGRDGFSMEERRFDATGWTGTSQFSA